MTTLDEIVKNCATNIKHIRLSKKLTQALLAEKIGITEKYVSDIETGRNHCSLDTLVSIANALEVEPYELLLPENKIISYDSRRTQIVLKTLKDSFSEMIDTLGTFLDDKK